MPRSPAPVSLDSIREAQSRLAGLALLTPLVECAAAPAGIDLRLKLENLQPIGAFKIRPVGNVLLSAPASKFGVYTASSGNAALALAYVAHRLGVAATAVVPDNAPPEKLAPLRRLAAEIRALPFEDWWQIILDAGDPAQPGRYVDAVRDPLAMAGNATIGAEIIAQWPDVEAIVVPLGGGGLVSGIASAARALKPDVKIIVSELESAAPLSAAFAANGPATTRYDPGFITGAGASIILREMWPLLSDLVDETVLVSIKEVKAAIRAMIVTNHIVAEGAGALAAAAIVSGKLPYKNICAVVSGGNINLETIAGIVS